jgi:phage-related protein
VYYDSIRKRVVDEPSQNWDNHMTRSARVPGEKPLFWVGSSKDDLLGFPEAVKDEIGVALSVAQFGGKHPKAKPWKREGPGALEIVEDHRGDTYRAVYTVKFSQAVYVLHAFQKKSPRGIKTAQTDVELVSRRLKMASEDYEARYGKRTRR